jgi:hypothetical protein
MTTRRSLAVHRFRSVDLPLVAAVEAEAVEAEAVEVVQAWHFLGVRFDKVE